MSLVWLRHGQTASEAKTSCVSFDEWGFCPWHTLDTYTHSHWQTLCWVYTVYISSCFRRAVTGCLWEDAEFEAVRPWQWPQPFSSVLPSSVVVVVLFVEMLGPIPTQIFFSDPIFIHTLNKLNLFDSNFLLVHCKMILNVCYNDQSVLCIFSWFCLFYKLKNTVRILFKTYKLCNT